MKTILQLPAFARMLTIAFLWGTLVEWAGAQVVAEETILPTPTGPLGIGRVSYHWIDSKRVDSLARDPVPREVMVDVWYPAVRMRTPSASYFPHFRALQQALPDSVLRRRYAPAYDAIMEGRLSTHAIEGSPAHCPQERCPLLLFSHGGGIDRSLYTAQFEDLASHGYVVASIAHTYLTHTVVFPDGRVTRLSDRRSIIPPVSDSSASYWRRQWAGTAAVNRLRYAQAAADLRFVLDQLSRHATDADLMAPFVGQVDLQKVGALGHSMGGLAVAMACRQEPRIKACLNQDGSNDGLPADRDAQGRPLSQPFMYFGRAEPPSRPRADSVLTRIEMTREEDDSIRRARPREQEALLKDVAGGAWRVRLTLPAAEHMSFSDELLITAASDSAARRNALQILALVRRYSRAFFDRTLRERRDTPLDRPTVDDADLVVVERFSAR